MARRWYRDPRTGRFISRAEWERQRATRRPQRVRAKGLPRFRRAFTVEEESILDDVRLTLRGTVFAAGTEFELTATTKGGTPRRR